MGNILVTGAAGFIGARTAQMLLDAGESVAGIDNLNDYYDVSVKRHRLKGLTHRKGFVFYEGDIEDASVLKDIFEREDINGVINLAARAGVRYSIENPLVYMTTNIIGTLNILELMRVKGIRKMVLASTSSLYAGHPMPFTEDAPVNRPLSPYAASKKAAEALAHSYHHLYGMDISVLRYFTVYGPAGRPDMSVFRFIKWIDEGHPVELFGDGSQSRDFTYIDDIARGTILALRDVGFEIINLGGGKSPFTINYLINRISELLNKDALIDYKPFHPADMAETGADISKAERLLGWSPQTYLETGLKEAVRWYSENKEWLREVRL